MVDFSRYFSMSAFEGARQIRIRRSEGPTRTITEIIEIIRTIDGDGGSYDFEAAIEIDQSLSMTCPCGDASAFYRDCIDISIGQHRPIWAKSITYGRKFILKLKNDEQQCFEAAGLLEDPPSSTTIAWWDRTSAVARMVNDGIRMEQARAAERMTIEYEIQRMARLGIPGTPKWSAVEDNQLGYDVLSYDVGPDEPVARVLEVKSTIASPPRFYVSRNEWDVCQKMGEAYLFHVWDMRTGMLHERTAAQVAPHIPQDQGTGRWSTTEIRLGSGDQLST